MDNLLKIDRNREGRRMRSPLRQRLFSIREAALYLGFSVRSIRNLIYSREIPIVRLGSKIFLDIEDLDLWIETKKRFA